MKRIAVVKNKDGSVSCLPVAKNKQYYLNNYNVLTFVNKMWNFYHVNKIKKYYM